jgi:hypothetical protein
MGLFAIASHEGGGIGTRARDYVACAKGPHARAHRISASPTRMQEVLGVGVRDGRCVSARAPALVNKR